MMSMSVYVGAAIMIRHVPDDALDIVTELEGEPFFWPRDREGKRLPYLLPNQKGDYGVTFSRDRDEPEPQVLIFSHQQVQMTNLLKDFACPLNALSAAGFVLEIGPVALAYWL